ncbi:MAG TPA: hypothetical protein VLB29_16555 [Nocardioidaceae bacterium]|nr:hypothetical protein [Nocardioidaceae bacterium]
MERAATPDHQTRSLTDAVVAFWVVLWLTIGVLTGTQIWSLASVSEAVEASATATDKAGEALQQLSTIPLVPDTPGELGNEVRVAADEIATSADRIDRDVRQLAVLVGVSIVLVPTAPVLFIYLPWRLRWRRTVESVREEVARRGRSPELDAYLAHRAVTEMGYRELTSVSRDPVGDLLAGRHAALADEQLRRFGLPAAGVTGRDGP